MAKFSIKNALVYGFSAYAKHFMLLVAIGLTFGAVQWGLTGVPNLVKEQLGIKSHVASVNLGKKMGPKAAMAHGAMRKSPVQMGAAGSKTAQIHHHLLETGRIIHHTLAHKAYGYMDNDPGQLFVLFLVWLAIFCLWVFLSMGLIRVSLDIVDKDTSSYERLFSQRAQFFPFLGVWVVFALLWFVIFLGSILAGVVIGGLLAIPLVYIFSDAGAMISGLVGFVAGMVVYIKFIMRYFFSTFCLIDKKQGIHKAFSCTYEITKGSVLRLLVLGIILSIPFIFTSGSVHLHARLGNMVANDSYHAGIIAKLILGVFVVWYSLCISYVYRKLSKK